MRKQRDVEAARQDLTVGMHAITEINHAIRYADTKAAALAAVLALGVTVLAGRRGDAVGLLPNALLSVCLCATLVSAALLAVGQAPRLRGVRSARRPNRIAFPSLAAMDWAEVSTLPQPVTQREDVWRQAGDLAAIAVVKFRWLHRAMISTICTQAIVLIWLAVTTWLR
ncbi:Pycsar system effector family protein [Actinoplanes solisilvae]|uniref:Pycsar system effector family protein n=1 Tax=Actinoplanes solisilvae TaxID=2486853 RepID=UPI000FDCBB2B|nr:Pycsar system effector family protein [Actinoplanes solisilvae]